MVEKQPARECAEVAIALARAAEMDDIIGETLWKSLDDERRTAVMYVLALWVAQFREGCGVPWDMLTTAASRLPDRP